jgi:2-polyprenyl-3-methyl-5-hydroxy-6-metoxy-1,4-benzoquinol methylase
MFSIRKFGDFRFSLGLSGTISRMSNQLSAIGRAGLEDTPESRKLKAVDLARGLLGPFLNPLELWRAAALQVRHKAYRHAYDDAQLELYSRIVPSEFLHYGYFEDCAITPEQMSLADVGAAQSRYAELVLNLVGNPAEPVLDVGCGMGGLSRMLRDRGLKPTALTPDRLQAAHIAKTLPDVPVLRCKFERLRAADYSRCFGTVINSESLQYLKLDQSLPALAGIIRPGGRWVVSDYFLRRPSRDRSCHVWRDFLNKARCGGWRVCYEQDITANILPTLAYVHMWAVRFGLPLMNFAFLRLRRRQPGLHHLMANALEQLNAFAAANIAILDPARFAAEKQYMLLALQRD